MTIEDVDKAALVSHRSLTDRVTHSRQLIQASIIEEGKPDPYIGLAIAEADSCLPGYATLDGPHRDQITKLVTQIKGYLRDSTRKRPFNVLMRAAPGAGKSYFIGQVAKSMRKEKVEPVMLNMATMRSTDDLAQPIGKLRRLVKKGKFPLLFLDEFDSEPSRFAALLPLLWDGELYAGQRRLKLQKAVIVLAGSNPNLSKAMDLSKTMRPTYEDEDEEGAADKLNDVLSRINGGDIRIPSLELRTAKRDRRVDKVCITIALLKARFGSSLTKIPKVLLRFVANTAFRYGGRSVAHLVDLIDHEACRGGVLDAKSLKLPFKEDLLEDDSLCHHLLDNDQIYGIVHRWDEFAKEPDVVDLKGMWLYRVKME